MALITVCNKIIEYSFYALFFLVPLVFAGNTFELFEFNKMWVTFGLTIVIGAAWIIKMVAARQIKIQRTPLDIPIFLFFLSQILSTIFSLDRHISIWGYYSRFNGGLLSILSYVFLYYAFVSNFPMRGVVSAGNPEQEPDAMKMVKRILKVSLASAAVVALWGLPSHFGYDPTCLLFRGTLDVACWTEAFQPKIRMFSTLGQPDWLAAYLAVLIPISIALGLRSWKLEAGSLRREFLVSSLYLLVSVLFYVDLLYTDSRSGFLAFWIANVFFWILLFSLKLLSKKSYLRFLLVFNSLFLIITFLIGQPISQLDRFTYPGVKEQLQKAQQQKTKTTSKAREESKAPSFPGELGGTDSLRIRFIVWRGALDIWKQYPLFGTGVESFAYSYYKFRPTAHNLTSEWDYLYNKAHNEFLNYLATTGALGLGSYLLMIGWFLFLSLAKISNVFGTRIRKLKRFLQSSVSTKDTEKLLLTGLLASYISILVSNFIGFSVVIINLYFFLVPAFVFALFGIVDPQKTWVFPKNASTAKLSLFQWISIVLITLVSLFLIFTLTKFWRADKAYALGYNLDRIGDYENAYPKLHEAIALRGDEPVFLDELSVNDAVLASALSSQQQATAASQLAQEAISVSNKIVQEHPNNVVFWKTRVRVFYALSQANQEYLPMAISAIEKAKLLAPTDAKISYNLGVLYGQSGSIDKAIKTLEKTIQLKPDYRDAYFALGLFYHEKAVDTNGNVVDPELQKKAVASMRHILTRLAPEDTPAKQTLESWGEL